MYFIENASNDPSYNLAFEEYAFRNVDRLGEGALLLWVNGPSVIVGRFQNTAQEVNAAYAAEHGIHVVRRITGGGAVYHDLGNLNYSFIVPNRSQNAIDFARFALPVVEFLRALGVPAELSGRNDLTVDDMKFSGTAQHTTPRATLHHGTLLFDVDMTMLERVLNVDQTKYESKGLKSVRSRVTNLAPYLRAVCPGITIESFKEALGARMRCESFAFEGADFAAIEELRARKYASWEWNWGESPAFSIRKARRFAWGKLEAWLDVREGRIATCRFYGDFFGAGTEALEEALAGVPYERGCVGAILGAAGVDRIFFGSSDDEILELLVGDEAAG